MHAYEKNTLPCLISARSGREGGAVIVLVQVIHCDGLSKRGTTRANVRTTDKAREAEVGQIQPARRNFNALICSVFNAFNFRKAG